MIDFLSQYFDNRRFTTTGATPRQMANALLRSKLVCAHHVNDTFEPDPLNLMVWVHFEADMFHIVATWDQDIGGGYIDPFLYTAFGLPAEEHPNLLTQFGIK